MRELNQSMNKTRRALYAAFAALSLLAIVSHVQQLESQRRTRVLVVRMIATLDSSRAEAESARVDRLRAAAAQESTRADLRALFLEGHDRSVRTRHDMRVLAARFRRDLHAFHGVADTLRASLPRPRKPR